MKDVAQMAGVSITTVSHVVNSTRAVAPETKFRVLDAIERTGYTGDAIARSLVTGGTRSLGVAISLVANPYFADLIQAIEHETAKSGYTLVLTDTHDEAAAEQHAVRALRSRRVDGLILTPSPRAAGTLLPELKQLGIPIVLVDRLTVGQDFDQVGPENVHATSALVQHLAERGHRRIGMVSGAEGLATAIHGLLHDPEKRRRLAEKARVVARTEYSPQAYRRSLGRLYAQAIEDRVAEPQPIA